MNLPELTSPLVGQYIDSYLPTIDGVIMTVRNYARWLNQDHFPCYVATAKAIQRIVAGLPVQVIVTDALIRNFPIPVQHIVAFAPEELIVP